MIKIISLIVGYLQDFIVQVEHIDQIKQQLIYYQITIKIYNKLSMFAKILRTSLSFRNTLLKSSQSFGNKTPFGDRPIQKTPFASKQANNPWSKQQKKQQPITPLTATAQQKPVQQTQIPSTVQPPPLDFGTLNIKKRYDNIAEVESISQNQKVQKVVMSNLGLNRYLSRIYMTSGISLIGTLASAYATFLLGASIGQIAQALTMASSILSFLAFSKANQMPVTLLKQQKNGQTILRTVNSFARLATYSFGCVCMGVAAGPLFIAISDMSTTIIPISMGVSAAIFGGSSLIGLALPRGSMPGYGPVLLGSVVGLSGLGLSGMIAAKYLAFPVFSSVLGTGEALMGIGVFSALIVYDTYIAIKRYENGDADHLGMSIQMLLDIWNIIIRVITAIAKTKAQKEGRKSNGGGFDFNDYKTDVNESTSGNQNSADNSVNDSSNDKDQK